MGIKPPLEVLGGLWELWRQASGQTFSSRASSENGSLIDLSSPACLFVHPALEEVEDFWWVGVGRKGRAA